MAQSEHTTTSGIQKDHSLGMAWDELANKSQSPAPSLTNEKRQKSASKGAKPTKTNHYNKVVEQQINRLVSKKLQDPHYVMDNILGIDFKFVGLLNSLHNGTVVLRGLSAEVKRYNWLETTILKVSNLPFLKAEDEEPDVTIKELDHAIPFLGSNACQVIIPYLFLRHVIQSNHNGQLPDIGRKLWYYTLNVANVALEASELTGKGNPQLAFTAGIFHGLSYVAIYKLFLTTFEEVRQANFDLARKQFQKDLFDAMQLLAPQRSHLSGLFKSRADRLSINLMNVFSGEYLKLNEANPYGYPAPDSETSSSIKQGISYADTKIMQRDGFITEDEADQRLFLSGLPNPLKEAINDNKLTTLDIFRRKRLGIEFDSIH